MDNNFPHWFQISGQLQPEDLPSIAQHGVLSIINLRPDDEDPKTQPKHEVLARLAQDLHLHCVHLPVISGTAPTLEQVAIMKEWLQTLPRPILAFCRSGTRAKILFQCAYQP